MGKIDKQTTFNFDENDKVKASFVKFDKEGVEVIGILESIDQGTFGNQFKITQQNGVQVIVGSYSALASKIKNSDVGKAIKIVYLGEERGESGRNYKNFDVYLK